MQYWMVVYNEVTNDFLNDNYVSSSTWSEEEVIKDYEQTNQELKVIHIGVGELPPRVYRSLKYVNNN